MQELLMIAIMRGEVDFAIHLMEVMTPELLLSFDQADSTAAHYFAKKRQIKGLLWLHKNLPETLKKANKLGNTPFILAVLANCEESVAFFLDNKIDHFASPAHRAAFYGDEDELALVNEGEVTKRDEGLLTPVIYAAASGKISIVSRLLDLTPTHLQQLDILFRLAIENQYMELLEIILMKLNLQQVVFYLKESHAFYTEELTKPFLLNKIEAAYPSAGEFIKENILKRYKETTNVNDYEGSKQIIIYQSIILGCETITKQLLEDLLLDQPDNKYSTIRTILQIGSLVANKEYENNSHKINGKDIIRMVARLCAPYINKNPMWFVQLVQEHIRQNNSYLIDALLSNLNTDAKTIIFNFQFDETVPGDFNTLLHMAVLYQKPDIAFTFILQGANPQLKNRSGKTPWEVIETNLQRLRNSFMFFREDGFNQKLKVQCQLFVRLAERLSLDGHLSPQLYQKFREAANFLIDSAKERREETLKIAYSELLKTIYNLSAKNQTDEAISQTIAIMGDLLSSYGPASPFFEHVLTARILFFLNNFSEALYQIDRLIQIHQTRQNFGFYPSTLSILLTSQISLICLQAFQLPLSSVLINLIKANWHSDCEVLLIGSPALIFHESSKLKLAELSEAEKQLTAIENSKVKYTGSNKKQAENAGYKIVVQEAKDGLLILFKWISQLCTEAQYQFFHDTGDKNNHIEQVRKLLYFKIRVMRLLKEAAIGVKNDAAVIGLSVDIGKQIEMELRNLNKQLSLAQERMDKQLIDMGFDEDKSEQLKASKTIKPEKKRKKKNTDVSVRKTITDKKKETEFSYITEQFIDTASSFDVNAAELEGSEWQVVNKRTKTKILPKTHMFSPKKEKEIIRLSPKKISKKSGVQRYIPDEIIRFFEQFPVDTLWLVGGAVRDALMEVNPKDFDFVSSLPFDELVHRFPNAKICGEGKNHSLQLDFLNFSIDIVSLQSDPAQDINERLKIDSASRDFTINALYWRPLRKSEEHNEDGLCKDFYNGKNHLLIEKKLVEIPYTRKEFVFVVYPKRFLRGIRLAEKYNLIFSDYLSGYQNEQLRGDIYNALFQLDYEILREQYSLLENLFSDNKKQRIEMVLTKYNLLNFFTLRGVISSENPEIKRMLNLFSSPPQKQEDQQSRVNKGRPHI